MIHVGFTGTRHGMSEGQRVTVEAIVRALARAEMDRRGYLDSSPLLIARHGDCVGADAEFHAIARRAGAWLIGHPPVDDTHRAFCAFDEVRARR